MKFTIFNHSFTTATVPASGVVKINYCHDTAHEAGVLFYDVDLAQWRVYQSDNATLGTPDNSLYPQQLPARLRELGIAAELAEDAAQQLCCFTRGFVANRRDTFSELKK